MWTRELLRIDYYHLIAAFVVYSMLGWMVESIYMSFCNRKLTNRGFAKVPFCPIYGFGAVLGYLLLSPLRGNIITLFLVGAVLATVFEFLVGKLMLRLFGELWWDYNDKPYNYKGIICLESTIAWGVYAIIIVTFLHSRVIGFINRYERGIGMRVCGVILFIVIIDYMLRFKEIYQISWESQRKWMEDKYRNVKNFMDDYRR